MGFSEDVMYDMAMKDIRTVFPEYDGWQKRNILKGKANERGFSFSRRIQGKVEQGIAWVSFSPRVTPEISAGFFENDEIAPSRTQKILLVPRSALVPPLTPGIRIKEMKSFGFDVDGRLVWLTRKKNGMDFSSKPSTET